MKRFSALILATVMCAALIPAGTAVGSGGVSWAERMIPGLDGDILSVEFTGDGTTGHILEDDGGMSILWSTTNSGATWTSKQIWPSNVAVFFGDYFVFNDIAFDWQGKKGWAVGEFTDYVSPGVYKHSPYIVYTTDGGKTWTEQTTNIDISLAEDGPLNAVHYFSGGQVYACGWNSMFLATLDWGANWEAVSHDDGTFEFADVTGGYDTGVYRAVCVGYDGAIAYWDAPLGVSSPSWSSRTVVQSGLPGMHLKAVTWPDTDYDRVLTVGLNGYYAWSNDNGVTWTAGDTGDEYWYGLDYQNSTTAFAVGGNGDVQGFSFNPAVGAADDWDLVDIGSTPAAVTGNLYDISSTWSGELMAGGRYGQIAERKASSTTRVSDNDRYTTAIAMSQDWPDNSVDTVVIATGLDFPDALSASGLAGALECPLLLAGPSLTAAVENEIARLDPDKIVIVGGYSVVSGLFQDQLSNALNIPIQRVAGDDRYHTSRLVAEEIATVTGSDFAKQAFIVRGDGFADALAVAPFAYSQKFPVILTATDYVPPHTNAALSLLDIEDGVIAGGTSAVSGPTKDTVDAIMSVNGGGGTMRWSGANRYETAAKVAEEGCFWGWGTPGFIGLATGTNFPDALGGGAVAGSSGGALLLTDGSKLSPATKSFLQTHSTEIRELEVFGGTSAVSDAVMSEADATIY